MFCDFCHLEYDENNAIDRKLHKKNHSKWERAVKTLGFWPRNYLHLEEQKVSANCLMAHSAKVSKITGALMLMEAYYERSLAAAITGNYWRQHPDFGRFVQMLDLSSSMNPIICTFIWEKFGKIENEIKQGFTYWYPEELRNKEY